MLIFFQKMAKNHIFYFIYFFSFFFSENGKKKKNTIFVQKIFGKAKKLKV